MESIRGFVEHIIFRNTENGYSVFDLSRDGEEVTCTGVFAALGEGESLELTGEFTMHPSYGEQFRVTGYRVLPLEDVASIERYLGSGSIRGIGPTTAARIVQRFGADTFRIMEEEPERLAEVKGISERKARDIAAQAEGQKDYRQAMIYLQQYGISIALAVRIYQTYGSGMYEIIRTNPYQLADDMTGVGFRTADEIAQRVGIEADSDFRICSGILYLLQQASGHGHTCLPMEILTDRTAKMLGVAPEAVEKNYMDMAIAQKIVIKQKPEHIFVYSAYFYRMEMQTAALLTQLNDTFAVDEDEIAAGIARFEKKESIELDEGQRSAVRASIENALVVITGGPGTGKTTTIHAILHFFEEQGMDIALAAPTGRAAKRMSEATGYEAKTIHRLLELNGDVEEGAEFARNETNPLGTDVIIIDEMSMVDILLMNALLRAIPFGTRLILVGDANQLPSVGPGSVLKDIIRAQSCPTVCLNKIFRQASQSDIIVNAHRIHRGEQVPLDNQGSNFFFLKRTDADVILRSCIRLVQEKLPKYVHAEPFDIQILTPTRKGLLGVERLNTVLQHYLNPPSAGKNECAHGSVTFREGDKVMQIRNNYRKEWVVHGLFGVAIDKGVGVFNGDMGIIRTIDNVLNIMTIEYDEGREVEYAFTQLDDLELAYAITIHKSQGSEYPAVVMPLLTGPRMLMNRNILYTAVTRAKSCVVIVGDEKVFAQMIENESEAKRWSGLYDRLMESRAAQEP